MSRRIPLWLTLMPLVVAIGLYWLLWSGWARDLEAELSAWLPGSTISISGFPYRIEADVQRPRLSGGSIVKLAAEAEAARLNRGPWQPELSVIRMTAPQVSASVSPLLSASLSGASSLSSLNVVEGRVLRFSNIIQQARIRLGFSALTLSAETLELHLRERTPGPKPDAGPTAPDRGQLVIAGTGLRLANGEALSLAADITATAGARLTDYDAWAQAGTLELRSLKLSDAHGEIATASATLVPVGRTGLTIAGTISTICPAAMAALFSGTVAAPEKRLRVPVRLAFSGPLQAATLAAAPALDRRPRREQLPDCPRLRG
jgi:hypothetical protein